MKSAGLPPQEEDRLAALRRYEILDTLAEREYDNLTSLAAFICETPIALVSFVDEDRQWFKSKFGIDANETPRDIAFCAHSILKPDEIFEIKDTLKDDRFHDNPLVTSGPNIRFYAGVPLVVSTGEALGTLCVIDRKSRELSDQQKEALRTLGNQVTTLLELRRLASQSDKENKIKSGFLGNMCHEIRTPLGGILTTTELLADTDLSPQQKKYVAIITQSGSLLQSLLNDILDYSKIEGGYLQLFPNVFSLEKKISKLDDLFRAQALAKGLDLKFEVETSGLTHFFMDAFRLFQIMANLIGNAIKFTETGSITVNVSCPTDATGPHFLCSITDTGIGIPKEYQSIIFNSFAQVDTSANRKGTGLGLSICASIVSLMQGKMGVESTLKRGSKFWFKVPAVIVSPEEIQEFERAEKPRVTVGNYDGCKILLVEDLETNRCIIGDMLTSMGCDVSTAENGLIAVEMASTHKYDLIFMDCSMPVMDGYQATMALRASGNTIPIVAITAHALSEEFDKCIKSGMSDHLTKPVKKFDLRMALDIWYSSSKGTGLSPLPQEKNLAACDFDESIINDFLKTNPARAQKLVALTRKDVAQLNDKLLLALDQSNAEEISENAHALKSVTAQVGGISLSSACRDLEMMGKSRNLSDLPILKNKYCEQAALFHQMLDRLMP